METNYQDNSERKPIVTENVAANKRESQWIANRKKVTGFEDKTLWDKLNLFGTVAVPLIIALATIAFSVLQLHLADVQHQQDVENATLQHQRDQDIALDQQRAAILQTYIDNIQDLLLNHSLLQSSPDAAAAILAEARTLTALQGLDSARKGYLIQFIYNAKLIGSYDYHSQKTISPILNLASAPLDGADFSGIDLHGADFSSASLRDTNLSFSNLSYANLSYANFARANLKGTSLTDADLSIVRNLTQQQLDQVSSCGGATLPSGLICPPSLTSAG